MEHKEFLKTIKDIDPVEDNLREIFRLEKESRPETWGQNMWEFSVTYINISIARLMDEYYSMNLELLNNENTKLDSRVLEINSNLSLLLGHHLGLSLQLQIPFDELSIFIKNEMDSKNITDNYYFGDSMMKTYTGYVRYLNILAGVYNNPAINLRPVKTSKELDDNFYKGGRICNDEYIDVLKGYLMDYLIHLSLRVDIETETPTTLGIWYSKLTIYLFRVFDLLTHDGDSIGRLYSVWAHPVIEKP